MFKRRKERTWWESTLELFYPRSGWRRAIEYIGHRIKRLPDTPHKISLGIACGVFVTFTPLFGLHFLLAAFLAWAFRGNVLAALLGTFVGNPITFPFIASISFNLGVVMLGQSKEDTVWAKVRDGFANAGSTAWKNFKSLFGYEPSPWQGMYDFFWDVFLPYTVGGIIPGIICGVIAYFVMRPVVAAYQKRRKGALVNKFKQLRAKRKPNTDGA